MKIKIALSPLPPLATPLLVTIYSNVLEKHLCRAYVSFDGIRNMRGRCASDQSRLYPERVTARCVGLAEGLRHACHTLLG